MRFLLRKVVFWVLGLKIAEDCFLENGSLTENLNYVTIESDPLLNAIRLRKAINKAVLEEISKAQRPGGLLSK